MAEEKPIPQEADYSAEEIFRSKMSWEFILQEQVRATANLMTECFIKSFSAAGIKMVNQKLYTLEKLVLALANKNELRDMVNINKDCDDAFIKVNKHFNQENYFSSMDKFNEKFGLIIRMIAKHGKYLQTETSGNESNKEEELESSA